MELSGLWPVGLTFETFMELIPLLQEWFIVGNGKGQMVGSGLAWYLLCEITSQLVHSDDCL